MHKFYSYKNVNARMLKISA